VQRRQRRRRRLYTVVHSIAFHFFIPSRQHNSTIEGEKNSQTHVHTFAFSNLIIHVRSHTQTFGARICVCSINDNILFYAQTGTEKRFEIILLSFFRRRKTVYSSSSWYYSLRGRENDFLRSGANRFLFNGNQTYIQNVHHQYWPSHLTPSFSSSRIIIIPNTSSTY